MTPIICLQAWPWQQVGPSLTTVEAQRQLDEQRQQQHRQHDASMGSDLLCLDQELASAFEVHQQTKQEHGQYYKECAAVAQLSARLPVYDKPLCCLDIWLLSSTSI